MTNSTCGPVLTYSTSDPVHMYVLANGPVFTYATCGLVLIYSTRGPVHMYIPY